MFSLHTFEEECVLHILFELLSQSSHCLFINDVSDVHFFMHHWGQKGALQAREIFREPLRIYRHLNH